MFRMCSVVVGLCSVGVFFGGITFSFAVLLLVFPSLKVRGFHSETIIAM